MNNVNKTLYIPLYGKAYVSQKGLFLNDKKAEEIWASEGFSLKGKSKSKWLAYYMGIRAAVFDKWCHEKIIASRETVVLHIGCGLDSRAQRINAENCKWYDVDFPEVIQERRRYYSETSHYQMIVGDARDGSFLEQIPEKAHAIVIMEGVSMYLKEAELKAFFDAISSHFAQVDLLMDSYSVFAAKMSKYKNPVNDVGVSQVYGMDDPMILSKNAKNGLSFVQQHDITPQVFIDQLSGLEKRIFRKLYAGKTAQKLYKLWEYKK